MEPALVTLTLCCADLGSWTTRVLVNFLLAKSHPWWWGLGSVSCCAMLAGSAGGLNVAHGRHVWPAARLPWVLCCRVVLQTPVLTCCYWDLHKRRWSPEAASSIAPPSCLMASFGCIGQRGTAPGGMQCPIERRAPHQCMGLSWACCQHSDSPEAATATGCPGPWGCGKTTGKDTTLNKSELQRSAAPGRGTSLIKTTVPMSESCLF